MFVPFLQRKFVTRAWKAIYEPWLELEDNRIYFLDPFFYSFYDMTECIIDGSSQVVQLAHADKCPIQGMA